jgi:tetratricopeptide (TPR) repeat protein
VDAAIILKILHRMDPVTKRVRFLTRQFILAALACVCLLLVGCEDGSSDAPPIRRSTIELRALHNRGVGLMGQFNYGEAAKVFEQLAAESPQAVDTQVDLAIALLNRREENDLMRSARLLDEVIELAPENLRAKYCRALLYFNDGQSEQASRLFQQVAQADPTDGYAVYYVGQCLFAAGEFAAALEKYQEAQATDPYLRSAYYGAFQSAQRLRDREEMQANLATFQRLADNPRARLAELKYTRMGPKAVVRAGNDESLADNVQPRSGPTFLAAAPLEITSAADVDWAGTSAASLTVADIDGDRLWDIFIAGGGERNVVLLQRDGKFELQPEHPLATVRDVVAPLWGDFDDDGLVDVYVCRNGPNRLWRQTSAGQWTDVTAIAGAASSNANTVDGACYDADHDGDLDYYLVNADGPNELLNNNRDGTFSPLANELGIAGRVEASRRVVLADLDSDDDLDMLLLSNTPPHEVMINDRLWEYRAGDGFDALCAAAVTGAVAVDADVDGQVELFTIGPHGVSRWATDDRATWQPSSLIEFDDDSPRPTELAVYDFLGYGRMQLATFAPGSWQLFELDGTLIESFQDESLTGDYGVLVGAAGPEVIAARTGGPPVIWRAGEGRGQYVRLRFVGRKDKGQEMRSNASGIGVQGAARIGTTWVPIPVSRLESGPGQSLQPVAVGVGIAEKIDFLQLLWPDGVSQSELDLRFGELHVIEETQRQAGSCPLVFVWTSWVPAESASISARANTTIPARPKTCCFRRGCCSRLVRDWS